MPQKTKWLLLTVAIQILIVAVVFRGLLIHPNEYFFEAGEDAIKSLMCMAYYVQYDHGLHFTGEIYPYGDHVIYADSEFPFSYVLQVMKEAGHDWSGYVPGIINSAMMWSFVPCAVFIFLILSSFNKKYWFNCLAAIGITMLSPQVIRMAGHFSLSYLFFIPMEWYFMMKLMQSKKKFIWMLLMILTLWMFGSMHLYYMAFIMVFVYAFVFIYLLLNRKNFRNAFTTAIPLIIAATLPYLITVILLKFTDPITDRVKTPWGFFFGYASFNSVFIPPLNNPLNFFHLKNGPWEGFSYVGVVGWIGLLLLLSRFISRIRKWKYHVILAPEFLKVSLIASVLVLLFSFAFPFRFGLSFLLDYLGVIKQFRSEGRFAWIFYYVFSVFTVYYIFIHVRMWSMKGKIFALNFILLLMVVGWVNDSYWNLTTVVNEYKPYRFKKEYFDDHEISRRLKESGKSANEFQAILTLPMYHNGSEKFWFQSSMSSLLIGLKAMYDTGLPMIDSHCGRTSLSHTMNALQLVSDTLIERSMLRDFPSGKPILLITDRDPLTAYEQELVNKAHPIFSDSIVHLFELPLSALSSPLEKIRSNFFAARQSMHYENGFFTSGNSAGPIIQKDLFQGAPFEQGRIKNADTMLLYDGPVPEADTSRFLEVSVWTKVSNASFESPDLFVREFDNNNTQINEWHNPASQDPHNAFGWLRQSENIKLRDRHNRILIFLEGGKNIEANYFLIRPKDENVYYKTESDSSFWLNNFYIGNRPN